MMVNENRRDGGDKDRDARALDDALAAYTDAVMAGQAAPEGAVDADLAEAVRALAARAQPEAAPPAALRRAVRRRIDETWEAVQQPWWARIRVALRQMARQPALVAAAALAVVALAAAFLVSGEGVAAPGTAAGPAGLGFWLAVGGAAVLVAVAIWWMSQKRP